MQGRKVLARAFGGKPLVRIAVEEGERVIYLSNPSLFSRVMAGESDPVGFPKEDVFEFDEELYRRLNEQWQREGHTDQASWAEAVSYEAKEPA